MTTDIRVMI